MSDRIPDAVIEAMHRAAYDSVGEYGSICLYVGHLRAALKAAEAMGYKLTSREPTFESVDAGQVVVNLAAEPGEYETLSEEEMVGIWRAMHDAAPAVE